MTTCGLAGENSAVSTGTVEQALAMSRIGRIVINLRIAITYKLLLMYCSIPSVVEIAFELISYARCVSIMLTSSSTMLTFDVSTDP